MILSKTVAPASSPISLHVSVYINKELHGIMCTRIHIGWSHTGHSSILHMNIV